MPFPTSGRFVKPDTVASHFHLMKGDRVGDFGAGSGFFTKALSQAVGNDGRVYACEIQKGLIEKIGILVRQEHLPNVEMLWSDLETTGGTKLADGILDAGILVNTLVQLGNKDAALHEIARTIRKGGKFFLIDWLDSFGGLGPKSNDVVDDMTARSLVESAGFAFERSFDAGEHHYGLAFRKL